MVRPPRSFATRLVVTYVGAAAGLLLLIGFASTLFTFQLYARTSNEVIASATLRSKSETGASATARRG